MMASKDRPVRTAAARMSNPLEALSRLVSSGRDDDEDADVTTSSTYAPAPPAAAPVRTASLGQVGLGQVTLGQFGLGQGGLGQANVRTAPTAPTSTALPPATTIAVKRVGDRPSVVAQAPVPPGQVQP